MFRFLWAASTAAGIAIILGLAILTACVYGPRLGFVGGLARTAVLIGLLMTGVQLPFGGH